MTMTMTMPLTRARAYRALELLTSALTWPASLLHELAHAAVATPGAKRVSVDDPVGTPSVRVEWRPDASGWLIVAAAYAPLLSGIVAGTIGLAWMLASGLPAPETARQWTVLGVTAIWYAIYVTPSPSDIRTAQEGIDRVRE
jgi:hypothetical protein